MRMVNSNEDLETVYNMAKSEAMKAFGSDEIYLEKYLESPKHIEVQILGDTQGNIVHLFERDCSVQRRHQKLVEIAPAFSLKPELRKAICDAAVKLMKNVNYLSAGTVEFLVTPDGNFYFIEVNPRIQVEHTVTEEITGFDIVQTQIKIAEGYSLHSPEIGIPEQDKITSFGHAIQCRITTEDPANNFMPDTGKLIAYRSGGGFGVRLDGGNAFTGSVITPYYDSLLVKATTHGLTHEIAITKMLRCLKEFRIRGVKTNILFLENVLAHPSFLDGSYNTSFVDENTELFIFPKTLDRGTRLLHYIADVTVNGYNNVGVQPKPEFAPLSLPKAFKGTPADGTKQILDLQGPEGLSKWVMDQKEVLFTDTTFRDAHQSLLATRMRTNDMLKVIGAAQLLTLLTASLTKARGNACASSAKNARTFCSKCCCAAPMPLATPAIRTMLLKNLSASARKTALMCSAYSTALTALKTCAFHWTLYATQANLPKLHYATPAIF